MSDFINLPNDILISNEMVCYYSWICEKRVVSSAGNLYIWTPFNWNCFPTLVQLAPLSTYLKVKTYIHTYIHVITVDRKQSGNYEKC